MRERPPHSEKTPEFLTPSQWTWTFGLFGVSATFSHKVAPLAHGSVMGCGCSCGGLSSGAPPPEGAQGFHLRDQRTHELVLKPFWSRLSSTQGLLKANAITLALTGNSLRIK